MPLTEAFMAVNIRNAFILNALCGAITAIAAVNSERFFRNLLDNIEDGMNKTISKAGQVAKNIVHHSQEETGKPTETDHFLDITKQIKKKIPFKGVLSAMFSLMVTFTVSFLVYSFLYYTLGFGGSMLTSCKPSKCVWS